MIERLVLEIIQRKTLIIIGLCFCHLSANAQVSNGFKGYRVERIAPLFNYEEIAKEGADLASETSSQDFNYEELLNKIEFQVDQRNYDEAIKIIDDILDEFPNYPWGYYLKGSCFRMNREYDSAEFNFNKVFEIKATQAYVATHIELGYLYLYNSYNRDLAEEHFFKALELWPESPLTHYTLSHYYYYLDKLNKSMTYAELAIEKDEKYLPAYFMMLEIWKIRLQYDMAQDVTLKMLEVAPSDEKTLLAKAALYFETDEIEFAIQTIKYLLREHPENIKALKIMSDYHYRRNELDKGFEFALQYLDLIEEQSPAPFSVFRLEFRQQFYRALKYARQDMHTYDEQQLDELFLVVRNILEQNWFEAQQMSKAWDKELTFIPTGLLMFRAILYEDIEDSHYWREDNINIINRDSTLYYIHQSLGDFYGFYELYDLAESSYAKMVKLDPTNKLGLRLRGYARMDAMKYKSAIQDFNIYLNEDTVDIVTYESRAECYKQLGYIDLAIKDLEFAFYQRKKFVIYDTFLDLYSFKLVKKDTLGALQLIDSALIKSNISYVNTRKISNHELYNLRGLTHLSLKKRDLADKDFSKAIEINPGFDLPWLNRGINRFEQGQFEIAKDDFDQFIKLSEFKGPGYFWRGKTKTILRDYSGARKDLKNALKSGIDEASEWLGKIGY